MMPNRAKRLIDRWFITGLSGRRWRTLRELLEASPEARQYYNRVATVRATLAGEGGLDSTRVDAIRERLFAQLSGKPERPSRWLVWAQFAATAIALLLLVALPRLRERDDLQPRGIGDQGVEARAFCVVRGARDAVRAVAVSETSSTTTCGLGDTLQLAYSVSERARPWARYVFLVGADERHQPLWYFPNPSEGLSFAAAATDGEHLTPDGIELAVNHQAGALWIYALFSSEPLSVDTVSSWLESAPTGATPTARDLATERLAVQRIRLALMQ